MLDLLEGLSLNFRRFGLNTKKKKHVYKFDKKLKTAYPKKIKFFKNQ